MRPPSRTKVVALWLCTAAALGLLAFTYISALADDRWPRGHPWHGIALVSMGGFFAIQTRLHRGGLATRALALALPLCAMAAMAIALSATRAPA